MTFTDIENVVLRNDGKRIIKLKDVADSQCQGKNRVYKDKCKRKAGTAGCNS